MTVVRALAAMCAVLVLAAGVAVWRYSASAQAAPNAMAIDADASTAGVDAARTVNGAAAFTTAVNITLAGTAYAGYQVEVSWPNGLSFSSSTQLQPASMVLCGTAILTPSYQSGCARSSGTTTFTGQVETIDFRCVTDGVWTIHMMTIVEDPAFGTTMLDRQAAIINTATADAVITCSGTGQAAPTDTPSPAATPTNTPVPTATCPIGGCVTNTPVPQNTSAPTTLPVFTRTPTPTGTTQPPTPTPTTGQTQAGGRTIDLGTGNTGPSKSFTTPFVQVGDCASLVLMAEATRPTSIFISAISPDGIVVIPLTEKGDQESNAISVSADISPLRVPWARFTITTRVATDVHIWSWCSFR